MSSLSVLKYFGFVCVDLAEYISPPMRTMSRGERERKQTSNTYILTVAPLSSDQAYPSGDCHRTCGPGRLLNTTHLFQLVVCSSLTFFFIHLTAGHLYVYLVSLVRPSMSTPISSCLHSADFGLQTDVQCTVRCQLGFILACEDLGRMFGHSFPACPPPPFFFLF